MKKVFAAFLFSFIAIFVITPPTFAANTTMGFSPKTGSFAKAFNVDLVINGNGDKFNAAQATVTLPPTLKIQDLVLGDCNFSFLTTPSMQNPSFAGVILSSYATKCTAYTLTLVPVSKGDGSIQLTKTSVRRFGDAGSILSTTQNGNYTLTAALKAPAILGSQTTDTTKNGLYTVYLKILSSENTPLTTAEVLLKPVSGKSQQTATTDQTGTVHFSNLQAGIYDATIQQNNKKVGENIINVSDKNHVLTLGINLKGQQNNPLLKDTHSFFNNLTTNPLLMVGILIIGILAGIGISLLAINKFGKKK